MRVAALIFGLLGALGSGFIGAKWLSDANQEKAKIDLIRALDPAKAKEIDRLINTAYSLLAAAVLGVVGGVLAISRKGMIAAGLFLVAFIVPLLLFGDAKIIIFTFGLALAALFAFFVRSKAPVPKPTRASRQAEYEAEEEEEEGPAK